MRRTGVGETVFASRTRAAINGITYSATGGPFDGSTDQDAAFVRARNAVAAACNTFSPEGTTQADLTATGPIGTGGHNTAYLCFLPASPTITPDAGGPLPNVRDPDAALDYNTNPPLYDPGPAPTGYNLTASTSGTVTVIKIANGATIASGSVTSGTAAMYIDPSTGTRFALTAMHVATTGSQNVNGDTYANGTLDLLNVWSGTRDGSGNVTVPSANASSGLRFDLNSTPTELVTTPSDYVTGTWNTGVSPAELTVTTTYSDGTYKYTFNLVFTASGRPTATITTPSTSGSTIEYECTGTTGVSISPVGSSTGSVASSTWSLWAPTGPRLYDGDTPTIQLPLYGYSDPALTLSYWVTGSSSMADLVAIDTRSVRAVDTTAPVISETTISVPAGWGRSSCNPNPQHPFCITISGVESDTCSVAPDRTRQFDSAVLLDQTGTQIGSTQTQTTCFDLPSTVFPTNSFVTLQFSWRVHDPWNVWSTTRYARFKIVDGGSNCGTTPSVSRTYDSNTSF